MNSKSFGDWLKGVSQLSPQQLSVLRRELEGSQAVVQTLNAEGVSVCPHCGSEHFNKFGWKHGLQRYRCKACLATFNRLTGSPLSRLRKKSQWAGVIESLNERETLDQMQARLAIVRSTAIRWRKRFLKALQPGKPPLLSGIVEADETYVRRGQKGTRCVERPPRKRAEPAKVGGVQQEDYVCVLMARDRNKQQAHQITESQTKEVFESFLSPLIAPDSILCSDGQSGYQKFSQKSGIQHVVLTAKRQEFVKAGVYHIQNINAYHSRLKDFLRRLKGVAYYNISHYLHWLDHLDRMSQLEKPLSSLQIMKSYILNT